MDMDKKQKILLAILSPILVLIWLYSAGFLAQMLVNYGQWQLDSEAGEIAPAMPKADIWSCFASVFHWPYGPACLLGILVAALGVGGYFIWTSRANRGQLDAERNISYSDAGAYGTAGFMTEKEMKEVLTVENPAHADGIILGRQGKKAVCLPAKTRMNRNIAVYGAPGSMKSRAFVRNMIFQAVKRGESMILTDPKSEIYEDMAEYIRTNGYNVKVLNLVHLENSDGWDCLGEVGGDQLMAQLFSDVIIKNTTSAMAKSDQFWDNGERNLLMALVLYVSRSYKPGQQTIEEVYKLICHKDDNALNALFGKLPADHLAKAPFALYAKGSETVRNGVITGLGSRLQVFQNNLICDLTSHPEIDLELPGKEKCAYFCITSDQDSTFDFLTSLFFSYLFIRLVRYADQNGGRCAVDVDFICDEFPNIGVIPDFHKKISTVRSRGLNISVIFQNLAQMQNRYPHDVWQEILGGCDTQLFLGCTDQLTAKYISERTGEITIEVASTQRQLSAMQIGNYTPQYRESMGLGRRKLMTMDEVLRMPLEKELLILRGQKVLMLDKFDYTLHPESKKLVKSKAIDHIPNWRTKQLKEAEQEEAAEEDFSWAEDPVEQMDVKPESSKPKSKGYRRIE